MDITCPVSEGTCNAGGFGGDTYMLYFGRTVSIEKALPKMLEPRKVDFILTQIPTGFEVELSMFTGDGTNLGAAKYSVTRGELKAIGNVIQRALNHTGKVGWFWRIIGRRTTY